MKGRNYRHNNRSNSYDKQYEKKNVFNADLFTKKLKTGKLAFKRGNERIAKYGKGFSNLLQLASTPELNVQQPSFIEQHHQRSPIMSSLECSTGGGSVGSQAGPPFSITDEMHADSANEYEAQFKVYRPDCGQIPNPLSYKEALVKYRRKEGSIDELERSKPLTNRALRHRMHGTDIHKSIVQSIGKPKGKGLISNRNIYRAQDIAVYDTEAMLSLSIADSAQNRRDFEQSPSAAAHASPRRFGSNSLPKIYTPRERASFRLMAGTIDDVLPHSR